MFFDYLYYKAVQFYSKTEDGAGLSGVVVIALLQWFNLFSISMLIEIYLRHKFDIGKPTIIGLVIFLLVVNGIRYNKLNYGVLKERWDGEAENIQFRKRLWVFLYVVGSTICCVGLAIYLGSKRW